MINFKSNRFGNEECLWRQSVVCRIKIYKLVFEKTGKKGKFFSNSKDQELIDQL